MPSAQRKSGGVEEINTTPDFGLGDRTWVKIVLRAAAALVIGALGRRDFDPHRHRDLRDGASQYLICPFFAAISPFLRSVLEERLPTERIFMPFCPPSLSFF